MDQFQVVVASPEWALGGTTEYSANLIRGLLAQGIPAHLLVTNPHKDARSFEPPADFRVEWAPWAGEPSDRVVWDATVRYLEERAPCVFVPNWCYMEACASPRLSDGVVVVGSLLSDLADQDDMYRTLGRYWNGTVAGSEHLRRKAAGMCPDVADRVCVLPYGADFPRAAPAKARPGDGPLRLLYTGRLEQVAKRVLDLPRVVEALDRRGVPVRLDVTGRGSVEAALHAAARPLVERGLVRFHGIVPREEVTRLYTGAHAFLLTSEFEGKPLSLVEAMGHGCVPVATDIPSGVPELVRDGETGYLVPVGAAEAFADRLEGLYKDPEKYHRMSAGAFRAVADGGCRVEDMVSGYTALFRRLVAEARSGAFRRPRGPVAVPPGFCTEHRSFDRHCRDLHVDRSASWEARLPGPVRHLLVGCKRALRGARGVFRRG